MNEYPLEICCDCCNEVVILMWEHIPGDTELRKLTNYMDGPFLPHMRIDTCPICGGKNPSPGEYFGVVPSMGFIEKMMQAQEWTS